MSDQPTTTSPLAEAEPRSLDEAFSARPPFDAGTLVALVRELRRMRVKWQQDEIEGKRTRAAKSERAKRVTVVGDLFAGDE